MSRAHAYHVLQNADGSVLTNVEVSVIDDGSNTLVADTLWTTETGSSTLSNPFLTTTGKIEFYLDAPSRMRLAYTPPGGSPTVETIDPSPDSSSLVVTTSGQSLTIGGAPDPTKVIIGGSDGKSAVWGIPEVAAGAPTNVGQVVSNPAHTVYLTDGVNTWLLTIDATGHLITTEYTGG